MRAPEGLDPLLATLDLTDRAALDRLFEAVYGELKRLARAQLRRVGCASVSTTTLVHEAYVKFSHASVIAVNDQQHFFSLAARAMRQILVDHARRRLADRRGGPATQVPLEDSMLPVRVDLAGVVAVDGALARLEAREPALARLVELRVFAGLTLEEIAGMSQLSVSTLKREWKLARAFLHRELAPTG